MALQRHDFRDDALPGKLPDNLFLLLVADNRFEFNNRAGSGHGNLETLRADTQGGEHALYFRGNAIRVTRGEAKNHHPGFQIESVRAPSDDEQSEKYDRGGSTRDGVKASARGHADGSFGKDGCRRRHADKAAGVFQNRSGAEKADALHDVGSNACGTGIAVDVADLDRKNGEKRRGHAHKHAGANARGAAVDFALDPDRRSERGRAQQPQQDLMKRNHRLTDNPWCKKILPLRV